MKQYPGMLVVLDGPDMSGKTGQRGNVVKLFRDHGLEVVEVREPGGTMFAEKIRELNKQPVETGETKHPITELLLNYAARAQLIREVIIPALTRGAVVVSDRYHYSSFVYQHVVGGVDWLDFHNIDAAVRKDCFNIDLTFIFDVDYEVAEERLRLEREKSGRPADYYDDKPAEYKQAICRAYRDIASPWGQYNNRNLLCIGEQDALVRIDANVSREQVFAQMMPHLMTAINSMKKRPTPEVKTNSVIYVRGVEVEVVSGDEQFRIGVVYQDEPVEFVTSDHETEDMVGLSKTSFDQFPARLLGEIVESVVNNLSIKQRDWIKELRVERTPYTGEPIAISAERDFRI
jgi:dTMP kinase